MSTSSPPSSEAKPTGEPSMRGEQGELARKPRAERLLIVGRRRPGLLLRIAVVLAVSSSMLARKISATSGVSAGSNGRSESLGLAARSSHVLRRPSRVSWIGMPDGSTTEALNASLLRLDAAGRDRQTCDPSKRLLVRRMDLNERRASTQPDATNGPTGTSANLKPTAARASDQRRAAVGAESRAAPPFELPSKAVLRLARASISRCGRG